MARAVYVHLNRVFPFLFRLPRSTCLSWTLRDVYYNPEKPRRPASDKIRLHTFPVRLAPYPLHFVLPVVGVDARNEDVQLYRR